MGRPIRSTDAPIPAAAPVSRPVHIHGDKGDGDSDAETVADIDLEDFDALATRDPATFAGFLCGSSTNDPSGIPFEDYFLGPHDRDPTTAPPSPPPPGLRSFAVQDPEPRQQHVTPPAPPPPEPLPLPVALPDMANARRDYRALATLYEACETDRATLEARAAIRALVKSDDHDGSKRVVLLLVTQIPRGAFTTYEALLEHLALVLLPPPPPPPPAELETPSSSSSSSSSLSSMMGRRGTTEVGVKALAAALRETGGQTAAAALGSRVPVHRVVGREQKLDENSIPVREMDWGTHCASVEAQKGRLREEGVEIDGFGDIYGVPFRGFVGCPIP
ncbi:hypothetical protein F5Y15DRAFT_419620 [Xylariaceae sp. FL0016]|nr:hypothetical protein F5Y15DRAFT_419620 [Xylariaceae sp. FL0016]